MRQLLEHFGRILVLLEATAKKSFNPKPGYLFPASGERLLLRAKLPVRRWFEYHCQESEDSADAELWHHTHQRCTVLRRLMPNESDYEMYEAMFDDGFVWHVMADELMTSPKKFYCQDYRQV